jgi:hypothetical protein
MLKCCITSDCKEREWQFVIIEKELTSAVGAYFIFLCPV